MELNIGLILIITLFAFLKAVDYHTTQLVVFNSVFWGAVTGLVLGDVTTGLMVGGTLQLMSLGVAAIGGSSAPDYPMAAIIATTIAISTGQGTEAGLALGIPVGMLAVQLDVIAKLINSYIAKKAQDFCNARKFNQMHGTIHISLIMMGLVTAVPVLISITLGKTVVEGLLNVMPVWVTSGFTIAGSLLPAVGIGMLLTYMPTKKFIHYLLIGFVASAYLNVPILGIAIIGFALALSYYERRIKERTVTTAVGGLEDE